MHNSIRSFVTIIAENIEHKTPIDKVIENPLIAPLPIMNIIPEAISVVRFESRIVFIAFLNPSSMARAVLFPALISSRMRSNIKTFASTDMPTVSAIPAIPGRVRVASSKVRMSSIEITLKTSATDANKPNLP